MTRITSPRDRPLATSTSEVVVQGVLPWTHSFARPAVSLTDAGCAGLSPHRPVLSPTERMISINLE